MSAQEFIESGMLELYVYGKLDESGIHQVLEMASKHSEINEEIKTIEKTLILFTSNLTPSFSSQNYERISHKLLSNEGRNTFTNVEKCKNWKLHLSYIFILLFGSGMLFFGHQYLQYKKTNTNLESRIEALENENIIIKKNNTENEVILAILQDPNTKTITLEGMDISPESYATAYWNQKTFSVYIDASGLPEPPKGKTYQVWALKLNPITPSSIGTLDSFTTKFKRFFEVNNVEEAEAFAITLETIGGNTEPDLKAMYTLGKVN